jgi:hypothetical protein
MSYAPPRGGLFLSSKSVAFCALAFLAAAFEPPKSRARKMKFYLTIQPDLGRPVPRAKIIRFPCAHDWWLLASSRLGKRGGRVVTNAGRDAMDARNVDTTSDIAADGEVVWSWRSDAGAKFAGYDPHVTVATKHGHRGDHV